MKQRIIQAAAGLAVASALALGTLGGGAAVHAAPGGGGGGGGSSCAYAYNYSAGNYTVFQGNHQRSSNTVPGNCQNVQMDACYMLGNAYCPWYPFPFPI
jgi:hypothetical protein